MLVGEVVEWAKDPSPTLIHIDMRVPSVRVCSARKGGPLREKSELHKGTKA